MALHFPTHPAGYVDHHVLRNSLLVISGIVLATILGIAAILAQPVAQPTTTTLSEAERMVQFREGERALWTIPQTESERLIEFRAGERALYQTPVPNP